MSRLFFTFILLLQAFYFYGQESALAQKVEKASCSCFGEIKSANEFTEDFIGECFGNAIAGDSDLFIKECLRLRGDTSDESLYKFGKQLFDSIRVKMIDDCDAFFVLMDSMRYKALEGLNEDSLKKVLKWFHSSSKAPDSSTFYSDRGILKFQLKDIKGAYTDLDKSVRLNPDNMAAHLFRGWVLEIRKEYSKAISDFQFVGNATGDPTFAIILAIVQRKKRMSEAYRK